jgi:hypothetical protein
VALADLAMAASRLNESQKQELVQRYQAGETAAALAEAFGCSANTVSRTVKAAIGVEAYGVLKEQRAAGSEVITAIQEVIDEPELEGKLALDDADDFPESSEPENFEKEDEFITFAPLVVQTNLSDSSPCISKPLVTSELPESLYLLVDREVELKGTPVKDFTELGPVASDEEELHAIALFINPRQAKRQCGRSQRVIKVPDSSLLDLTAPYILAQGISRIVLDGALYAVPGSAIKP